MLVFFAFGAYSEKDQITNRLYGYRALQIIQFLFPKDVVGKEFVRVGSPHDGGYTMVDDFSEIKIAYSIGVGHDWSWDSSLTACGINVYMFDPTIKAPKLNNSRLKYYNIGIAPRDIPDKRLTTLENMLKLDGNLNKTNMIFKIDVEGYEWDVLYEMDMSTLEKFSQILIEFHGLRTMIMAEEKFKIALTVFQKLNETHQLTWVHGTNACWNLVYGQVPLPDCFEVGFIRRTGNMEFTKPHDRKRTDERTRTHKSEVLLWWIEGGADMDMDDLLNFYKSGNPLPTSTSATPITCKKNNKNSDL